LRGNIEKIGQRIMSELLGTPSVIGAGLRKVRKRRWLLWGVLLVYVPAIWLSLTLTHSDRITAVVFGVWLVALIVAVLFVSTALCPRCGNYFHVYGMTPLYLRRCLHCKLHITADKKSGSILNGVHGGSGFR
jgi:hypothetical protein